MGRIREFIRDVREEDRDVKLVMLQEAVILIAIYVGTLVVVNRLFSAVGVPWGLELVLTWYLGDKASKGMMRRLEDADEIIKFREQLDDADA